MVGLEAFAAAGRRADRVGGGDLVVVGATDCSWAAKGPNSPLSARSRARHTQEMRPFKDRATPDVICPTSGLFSRAGRRGVGACRAAGCGGLRGGQGAASPAGCSCGAQARGAISAELAFGAIGEGGVRVTMTPSCVTRTSADDDMAAVETAAGPGATSLGRFREGRDRISLTGGSP